MKKKEKEQIHKIFNNFDNKKIIKKNIINHGY